MCEPVHYDPEANRNRQVRLEAQRRRLGDRNPTCSVPGCTENDAFALTGTAPDVVCYEHRTARQGRDPVEAHHVAGRANDSDLTVPIPGNDHRVLSDLQRDWPIATLRNLESSPLIRAAGFLRGWLDVLWVILTRGVAWIPAFLERLDEFLTNHFGSEWWRTLGLQP